MDAIRLPSLLSSQIYQSLQSLTHTFISFTMAFIFGMGKKRAYNWYISILAAMCMILYGYDASVFNAVQGSKDWKNYFNHPDANKIGAVNTAYTCGSIIAGYFFVGPLANWTGRRIPLIVGCVFVIVATFIQCFTPRNIGGFIAGRLLVGIGQGLALPIGPIYIAEMAPADIRGKIMTFWQTFYSVGSFLAYWINYGAISRPNSLPKEWDWRLVVIFQLLAPVLIIAGIFFAPESARWLVQQDRHEAARRALQRVRDDEDEVEEELLKIQEAIAWEKNNLNGSYRPFFKDPSVRKRFLIALFINGGQQLTGQGSLVSYSTIIYQKVFASATTIQLINALNATFGILFTLNAAWIVDRFGRKPLLLAGAVGQALCTLIVAILITNTQTDIHGGVPRPVGIATVFLLFLFILFYKPSWGATVWIWTSEVFSMNIRAQGMGMASQFQNVANAILNQVFPLFLEHKGFYAFYMFFALNVVLLIGTWWFLPETKGKTLEEIDVLFGGVNHITAGEHMIDNEKGVVEHTERVSSDSRDEEKRV